jgi:hypothetical protein
MTGHVCYQVLTGTAVTNLDPAAAVMLATDCQDWTGLVILYLQVQ